MLEEEINQCSRFLDSWVGDPSYESELMFLDEVIAVDSRESDGSFLRGLLRVWNPFSFLRVRETASHGYGAVERNNLSRRQGFAGSKLYADSRDALYRGVDKQRAAGNSARSSKQTVLRQ